MGRFRTGVVLVGVLLSVVSSLSSQDRGLTAVARQIVGKADFDVGKQYALIIGIDKYQEWTPLKDAVSEARKVREILDRRYYIDEFIELYDKDATAGNIRKMLTQTLPAKISKNDSLLIFYAGHGNLDESNTGSWIAVDGTTDAFDQKGWIPNQQLRNMIGLIKAQRVLVMADACFSGDFLNTSRGAAPTINAAFYQTALQKTARQVLTSGASETVPDQSEFGASLLNMLERNNDPVLDTNAMFVKIRTSVSKTQPLIGTIPGDDNGTFALFLKPQFGLVRLTSIADAKIFLDDTEVGSISAGTSLLLPKMASGSHSLSLSIGSQKETKQFVLAPDQELTVNFNFKPVLPGSISVSAAASAEVLLDGRPMGTLVAGKPLLFDKILEGDHLVTLKYRDNQEDRKVAVLGGQTSPVSFNYVPEERGAVLFSGYPEGSVISSAGREVGVISGGKFLLKDVRAGNRSFQVSYDLWGDAITVKAVVADSQATTVTFAGGQLLLALVPENTSVTLDGQTIVRSGKERRDVVVGPYPEGSYSLTATGENWENLRQTVSVVAGKDTAITLGLVAKRAVALPAPLTTPVAPTTNTNSLFKAGLLMFNAAPDQQEKLDIQIRRVSPIGQQVLATKASFQDDPRPEYFQGDPMVPLNGPMTLPPGTWLISAKRASDIAETYWQSWAVNSGDVVEVNLPKLGFSLPWQVRQATNLRDSLKSDYLKIQGSRDFLDGFGTLTFWLGNLGVAASIYGWTMGPMDQVTYDNASTRTQATAARTSLIVDTNLAVFGGVTALGSYLLSMVGWIETPDLQKSKERYHQQQLELNRLELQSKGAPF